MKKKFLLLLPLLAFTMSVSACGTVIKPSYNQEIYAIYKLAQEAGFQGTYEEWLASIKGKDGKDGQTPFIGENGNWWIGDTDTNVKAQGQNGKDGVDGEDGENGTNGKDGQNGTDGQDGKSAYEIYIAAHPEYEGDEKQWMDDLVNGKLGTKETCYVTFDPANNKSTFVQEVLYGEKAVKPTDPEKAGYVFNGWFTEQGNKWLFDCYNVTNNMKLTANYSYLNTDYTLSIANKMELSAEWHAKGSSRTVNISIDPAIDIESILDSGKLVITSSNPSVVSVSRRTLKPEKDGNATITATFTYIFNGETKTTTDTVDLTILEKEIVHVSSVTLNRSNLSLAVGQKETLIATINPSDADDQSVTWSSTVTSVAEVNAQGEVVALAAGTTQIKVVTNDGNKEAVCNLTVTAPISVTGVTLNTSSLSINKGTTGVLSATVSPSNADDKSVTWSSSDSSIASVSSNGIVTGNNIGSCVITATTNDGGFKANCAVTVTKAPEVVTETVEYIFTDAEWSTDENAFESDSDGFGFDKEGVQVTSSGNSGGATSVLQYTRVSEVVVYYRTNNAKKGSGEITVCIGDVEQTLKASSAETYTPLSFEFDNVSGNVSFVVEALKNSIYIQSIEITYSVATIEANGVIFNNSTDEITQGKTKQTHITYVPSDANTGLDVSYTSSNTNIATVNNKGLITLTSQAAIGDTFTVTVKLTSTGATSTMTFTVVELIPDKYTIMIYMCGSDLESDGSYGTKDITELLNAKNQPDDVNIILETGGTTKWSSTYSISANNISRYEIQNNKLKLVEINEQANMASSETLEEFMIWGLDNYPAEKTSFIFWNHGGAMDGVCCDDNYATSESYDYLTNDECYDAFENAFEATGTTSKLEWVGYDACLMSVQDVAEFNSHFFNYMISSQESESAYGWAYTDWVQALFDNPDITTPNLAKYICDSFATSSISAQDQEYTLSCLDLTKMDAYKTAFENFASGIASIVNSSEKWDEFAKTVNQALRFGYYDYYSYYGFDDPYVFEVFDIKDVISKLKSNSTYSSLSSVFNALETALNNMVVYNKYGSEFTGSKPCGLCMFIPTTAAYSKDNVYTSSTTNFTNWLNFVNEFGNWYDGEDDEEEDDDYYFSY